MRGDRPWSASQPRRLSWFTPHARGSTSRRLGKNYKKLVYPACAGIDRRGRTSFSISTRLPRMRGDRPYLCQVSEWRQQFTPHARGSTARAGLLHIRESVYPACAGIDPSLLEKVMNELRLPRMRGDRPYAKNYITFGHVFTPHARGSTIFSNSSSPNILVYPACAGIDLDRHGLYPGHYRLPRMRGDRPGTSLLKKLGKRFTPHARGSN